MSIENKWFMDDAPSTKILIVNTLCEDNTFTSALVNILKRKFINVLVAHNRSELIELLTYWIPDRTLVLLNRESKINLQFIQSTRSGTRLGLLYPEISILNVAFSGIQAPSAVLRQKVQLTSSSRLSRRLSLVNESELVAHMQNILMQVVRPFEQVFPA